MNYVVWTMALGMSVMIYPGSVEIVLVAALNMPVIRLKPRYSLRIPCVTFKVARCTEAVCTRWHWGTVQRFRVRVGRATQSAWAGKKLEAHIGVAVSLKFCRAGKRDRRVAAMMPSLP